ncbi:MAG: hypothetical protein E4G96_01585 [Chrysiogenales bacterium]|nr:MAG: hypothetical protein E4G96_01585 [Chrysiogenales bacterium]
MALTRKKYVLDKKFQFRISFRAVILPLLTTLAICAALLYFAAGTNRLIVNNNLNIDAIIDTQQSMLDMFLAIPALQDPASPTVKKCNAAFKENLKLTNEINSNHEGIKTNNRIVLYILIFMTVVQTLIIFSQFIFLSHKISGPIHVMSNYLAEIRKGNRPEFRPLRKNDELKRFYDEFRETVEYLSKK